MTSSAIMIAAAILRLYHLSLKPLHHDEGVNGFFLTRLFREGFYQYDPANYHGPTLYYFALVAAYLNTFLFGKSGYSTFAIRLVPVLFGVATVWLVLLLRRHIGAVGALAAAALIAVSPGSVYMSRYFIHESLFVFLTLALVVAALRYYEEAQPLDLMLAAVSAALLFATKETAMISVAVLIIAVASTAIYLRLHQGLFGRAGVEKRAPRRKAPAGSEPGSQARASLSRFGGPSRLIMLSLSALALFILVYVLFYSSFFSNFPKGVKDSIETFKVWTQTGQTQHPHPWWQYLRWLLKEEALVLVLGAVGAAFAVWRANNRFAIFAAQWAWGLLAAYSLIKYKTPWLAINFILPLAIISGYAVEVIYQWARNSQNLVPITGLVVAMAAIFFSAGQAVSLNFFHYDDDKYPYVYAHTHREFLSLVDDINRIAQRAGTSEQTTIAVMSPDYWPLPWYLRNYKNVGYHSRVIPPTNEALIIINQTQEQEAAATLRGSYRRLNSYVLRPGVTLVLYARRDVAS